MAVKLNVCCIEWIDILALAHVKKYTKKIIQNAMNQLTRKHVICKKVVQ